MASRFLYLVRHGAAIDDGPLSEAGQRQARLVGERLRDVPFSTIAHSPLPRAAQTARVIAGFLPDVPVHSSELLGDYLPAVPDLTGLPPAYADVVGSYGESERVEGPLRAAAAIRRYAGPADQDCHELIVTHNFLIGWFVRHALDAPDWRWLGLNQSNAAITVILYRPNRPAALVSYNDTGHLPPALRWTGFPPELRG